jgi:hypothetical protein
MRRRWRKRAGRRLASLALLLATAASDASRAEPDTRAVLEALAALDLRLATVGERLSIANAALCADTVPRFGLLLHDLSQYTPAVRPVARSLFAFAGPIAVEDVVRDGPAARAGVARGDTLSGINGEALNLGPAEIEAVDTKRAIAAEQRVAASARTAPVRLNLIRAGAAIEREIAPQRGCASRFEVSMRDSLDSRADGSVVQLSAKMMEAIERDDELAALVAHELAHNILRHRARLDSRGVDRGMLAGFGANVGYIRRSEVEADMLGAALLANAGYDSAAAGRFWRWFGPKHASSILLDRTHPKWSLRAKLVDREAERWRASPQRPYVPAILAERDKPMSRDWQSLVAGL